MSKEENTRMSVIVKNGKYLMSHGYAVCKKTFRWTIDIDKALKFNSENGDGDYYASLSKGKEILL